MQICRGYPGCGNAVRRVAHGDGGLLCAFDLIVAC
jgi:hypothetical protein